MILWHRHRHLCANVPNRPPGGMKLCRKPMSTTTVQTVLPSFYRHNSRSYHHTMTDSFTVFPTTTIRKVQAVLTLYMTLIQARQPLFVMKAGKVLPSPMMRRVTDGLTTIRYISCQRQKAKLRRMSPVISFDIKTTHGTAAS